MRRLELSEAVRRLGVKSESARPRQLLGSVWGLGFKFWKTESGVLSSVQGVGCRIEGLGCRVRHYGLKVFKYVALRAPGYSGFYNVVSQLIQYTCLASRIPRLYYTIVYYSILEFTIVYYITIYYCI